MELKLEAALETADSEELLRLCARLKCSIELEVRGLKQSVAHHVARSPVSLQCLRLLIDRLGPGCLTCKNRFDETPVHLTAEHQDESWMQLLRDTLGKDCFEETGYNGRTAAHCAAMNRVSNASLKWLAKELGSSCLSVPDRSGDTAVHHAAMCQSADSLQFLADQLGAAMFSLKNKAGETLADWVEKDWIDRSRRIGKLAWVSSQQRLLRAPRPQPPPSTAQPAEGSSVPSSPAQPLKPLDPCFTKWDFILKDGKKQLIGAGGFGRVFKALTDRYQTVAVKIVKLQGASDSESLEKAIELEKRGVEILKSVRHPNIVLFLKCERTAAGFCIFSELVSGHSLSELMQLQKQPFTESGVQDFSRQICSGLNFLHCQPHRPILHRDIKCSNIMLTHKGVIKLIDFGLAKEVVTSCGLTTNLCGTWHFMAPELFSEDDSIPYSDKTDVWAFGCTVFEMTEMKPPNGQLGMHQIPQRIRTREMPQIAERFSASLREFYLRCVAKDPRQRADTAELRRHSFLWEPS